MTEWFQDESFWSELYPFMFSKERLAAAESEAERVLELVGFSRETILDLACGPGRHAVALAQRGFSVTGVDLSSFLLDKARARATDVGVEVEWVHQDMREFVRPDSFDMIQNLFTSFGYFDDRGDDLRVLRNCHRSLRPGGILVMDMAGKEIVVRQFEPTT